MRVTEKTLQTLQKILKNQKEQKNLVNSEMLQKREPFKMKISLTM